MQIVEYRKHLVNREVTDPEWVIKGGYFYDRDTDTYMGFVLESSERNYYIPDTVTFMTQEEAIQRVKDIHATYPWLKSKDENLNRVYKTEEEIVTWVTRIIEELPDSANMY